MTVRIDEKGTIWVGAGAVVLYGPFPDDERASLRRRIVAALEYEEPVKVDERTPGRSAYCSRGRGSRWHRICKGFRFDREDGERVRVPCECECHD